MTSRSQCNNKIFLNAHQSWCGLTFVNDKNICYYTHDLNDDETAAMSRPLVTSQGQGHGEI